ncbi:tetratricopeptide repeat protein [Streptomyces sp. NPDC054796]
MTGHYDGRAEGEGRVYQATGDQHITEHHHHGVQPHEVWTGTDSVRRPAVGRVPARLRDRTELMARLRAAVAREAGGQVYVLHGLGGCGKTAVAYEVFQHATGECARTGLWVNASDAASLRSGMLAVAADRGAGDGELQAARSGLRAAADMVWDRLDASAEPWLLVLDNADDPAVLRDGSWLRTSPRGIVLVTSRQAAPRWWPGADLLELGVLPREEAARVLCDLAPETGTEEEAAAIADRLGRLPLALTLAGGFLAHQVIEPWSMSEYGRHLEGGAGFDAIELIDQGADALGGNDSRHLVSRTWQFSLNALVDQGLPEAVTLLRLLSCWAGDPLPVSLLTGAELGRSLPRHRVEVALRGLLDHSLTSLTPGTPRTLRTHAVLLDSVARGVPEGERDQTVATAARLLRGVLPEQPERTGANPFLALLVPHTLMLLRRAVSWPSVGRDTVGLVGECVRRLVVALHRSGDRSSSLSLAEKALELAGGRFGADHPWLLRLRYRVARSLYRLGRYEEAESLYRELLAADERVFGEAGGETMAVCEGLALTLWQRGRLEEAMPHLRRAERGYAEALGPMHPRTLLVRTVELEVCTGAELEEAAARGPALLDDCRRELGPDHTITLVAELNYAHALYATGQLAEALPRVRAACAAYERSYGPEFPVTLSARTLLGLTLFATGEREEAIAHMAAVLEGRERVLGAEHPFTAMAREKLAEYRTS